LQILQTLAAMLEAPQAEKIHHRRARGQRSASPNAALYRHFASKAQMYEGLIEFIEQTLFGLIARITHDVAEPVAQTEAIVVMLLNFAHKNQGMTRVLIGDALVNENERLQKRINQLHDRLEAQLRQCLRFASARQPEHAAPLANLLLCFVVGRWHQFAKSGFVRAPNADIDALLGLLLADLHTSAAA
jgi:cell division inhibitor SlmA